MVGNIDHFKSSETFVFDLYLLRQRVLLSLPRHSLKRNIAVKTLKYSVLLLLCQNYANFKTNFIIFLRSHAFTTHEWFGDGICQSYWK